ncbi:hypothetical protein [Streptomyces griseoruber]|uniref:hypothetical protein n=1 Tax=Streptomyces griseoruber TaxID=1943 RepID=UPI0037A376AF
MCLSEPQAGSSLMWISAGDHELSENIVPLVLAKNPRRAGGRVGGPAGVQGISPFAVPSSSPGSGPARL